jgi:hypothetical protein
MRPSVAAWWSAALVALAAAAAGQELAALLGAEVRLERRQMLEELRRHGEARRREGEALALAGDLQARLDRLLAAEAQLPDLEEAERALAAARGAAANAAAEAEALRRSVYERRRRLQLLAEESAAVNAPRRETSPISGAWDVRILPFDQQGVFELDADGTLVSGSYRLGPARTGSFRGTWAAGILRLERIDAAAGFDSIFEGRLSADGQRIDGTWQATLLNSAGPGGGTWVAMKRQGRVGPGGRGAATSPGGAAPPGGAGAPPR